MNRYKQLYLPNQQLPTHAPSCGKLCPTPVGPPPPTPLPAPYVGPPTPVGHIIGQQRPDSTVALAERRARLQGSKTKPIPTQDQRIKELSFEKSSLQLEPSYHQRMNEAGKKLEQEVRRGLEIQNRAVSDFLATLQQVEYEQSHISGQPS
jgi:hypothetical protein